MRTRNVPGGEGDKLRLALEILKRIPRSRSIDVAELQQQLEAAGLPRSARTVQRRLEALSEQFDIDRDTRSKPYGYRWKPNAAGMSVPGLTEKEALLLTLAQQHLAALLPGDVVIALAPFFEQARRTLAPDDAVASRAWLKKVRVVTPSQPLLAPPIRPEVLASVSRALYRDQWLELDYRNAAGREHSARVMPLGLAQQAERMYLVCRFDGYDNERSLALHRIVRVRETGLAFKRPRGFDLEQYDGDDRFGFGEGKRIRLKFWIERSAGQHLTESRLSADQTIAEARGGYSVEATVVESDRLRWWLRGFGDEIRAVAPRGLL